MTFSNRKFGVEIEYTSTTINRQEFRNVLTNHGLDVHQRERGSLSQWSIVYDGSVNDPNLGGELVSPVLSGPEGVDQVRKVSRIMMRNGARADRSCGLHVHVDATDLTPEEIKTVAHRYARFESEIDTFMPRSRRGNGNSYCHSMNNDILNHIDRCNHRSHFGDISRYYKLNVNAVYKHGTIEFRQHSGSINPEKIINWIKFCVTFVEQSREINREVVENFNRLQAERAALVPLMVISPPPPVPTPIPGAGRSITLMNNPNRPSDYPLSPVSDYNDYDVQIVDRLRVNDTHFRRLNWEEQRGLSHTTIKYVLRALINGIDIEQERVYTFSVGTIRRAMSALRNVGFKITHRRGTGHYILDGIQPRSVFSDNVRGLLFDLNYVDIETRERIRRQEQERIRLQRDQERERERQLELERERNRPRYTIDIVDTLFRGLDEEIVAFYNERSTEFQDSIADTDRNQNANR